MLVSENINTEAYFLRWDKAFNSQTQNGIVNFVVQ